MRRRRNQVATLAVGAALGLVGTIVISGWVGRAGGPTTDLCDMCALADAPPKPCLELVVFVAPELEEVKHLLSIEFETRAADGRRSSRIMPWQQIVEIAEPRDVHFDLVVSGAGIETITIAGLKIGSPGTERDHTLVLRPRRGHPNRVVFHVADEHGEPIAGAYVTVDGRLAVASSRFGGTYTAHNVAPGRWPVTIVAGRQSRLAPAIVEVDAPTGDEAECSVTLSVGGWLTLRTPASDRTLELVVIRPAGGTWPTLQWVVPVGPYGYRHTQYLEPLREYEPDATLVPGDHEVVVRAGEEQWTIPFTIRRGETTIVELAKP
jgi:hypothetical protein